MVAPYGYNSRGWYGSQGEGRGFIRPNSADPDNLGELSEKDVLNVLGIIQEEFSIDENRIYLMGHSMGGGGTIHIGTTYPEIWAGPRPDFWIGCPDVNGSATPHRVSHQIDAILVDAELFLNDSENVQDILLTQFPEIIRIG